jgi:hypothetical protein
MEVLSYLKRLRKARKYLSRSDVPAEIQAENLLSASLDRYCHANPLARQKL